MKKLLVILLCLPLIGWTQGQINCSLLDVTDVVIENTNMTIDIAIYNGDTMDVHYPFIAYTIDDIGDTIQNGDINWFVTPVLDTTWYSNILSSSVMPSFPLSIYFTYTNLTGTNPGDYTCLLTYNISPTSINDLDVELDLNRKCIKIIDVLGKEIYETNQPLFYIFNDGTVEKRLVIA